MSVETAKRAWERLRGTLELAHLVEFTIHAGQSDVLALLIFALKWPVGWMILGWLLAAYFWMRLRRSKGTTSHKWKKKLPEERDHLECKPLQPEQRKARARKGRKSKRGG